jgi:hypothetical protein
LQLKVGVNPIGKRGYRALAGKQWTVFGDEEYGLA